MTMPQFFPPTILSILNDKKKKKKKKLFICLEEQLENDSIIYSQCSFLKTTIEGNIIDGESDFIIVIPQKGILFLEVKVISKTPFDFV